MTSLGQGYGQVLREFGISPKKRLGQHFMIDPGLLEAIARLMLPAGDGWVALELGAGIGTLTRELSRIAQWVYAVEMDRGLDGARSRMTGEIPNLTWIWGDALEQDLTGSEIRKRHPGSALALCGNLPYYITSEILYRVLIPRTLWARLSFVVQEEVGERMAGPAGTRDFGRLSLWCQYRAEVAIEKRVSRGSFVPRPEVASCLVSLRMRTSFPLQEDEEQFLDTISRAAFSKRRKTISNGLNEVIPDRDVLAEAIRTAGVDPTARPEDLCVGDYVSLTKTLWSIYRSPTNTL